MSKNPKKMPEKRVQEAKPVEKVLRIGSEVAHKIVRVGEYGTDSVGPYVVVEFGEPDGQPMYVKAIDVGTNDNDERFTLTAEKPAPGAEKSQLITEVIEHEKKIDELVDRVGKMETKPVQPTMVRELLHVRLTDAERDDAARAASRLVGELADAEEEFKNFSAAHKARVKEVKAKIAALTDAHNTGLQYQTVACEQRFDVERERTWFVYRDQVYGERTMSSHELRECQRSLFGDAPALPNKVDPSQLPHPSNLGGDTLAKQSAQIERIQVGEIPEGKRRAPVVVDRITAGQPVNLVPESRGGVANGVDPDIAAAMREETKRGAKQDHTVS